jgi:hypothetical protein
MSNSCDKKDYSRKSNFKSSSSSSDNDNEHHKLEKKHHKQKKDHKHVEKELEKLENKVEKKVDKKVEKLENKVKENKIKEKEVDLKLEDMIEKLNHKVNENERKQNKLRLKYKNVVHRLRRERCLMVNGCDAYGTFYSTTAQTVKPNDNINLEKKVSTLNLKLRSNGNGVKILREGVYVFNFTAQFDEPSQVAFFVNDEVDLTTVTATNNPTNTIVINHIVKLYEDDFISFKNYLSSTNITTTIPTSGLIPCSVNVDFSIWRIAPIPDKHCLPPHLNEDPWCYSESSSDEN